ncbi:hypothetical protein ITP53_47940 [Nonomuraea sp. K274]|uniref:Uncharacterized protein n=1 Tax=Nonomuraea cypriaca TaxID=1187855 RepID=A0A931AI47_9ACTN|nr:hypothetical protein [Nonomuraea cypriaca]MBF8193276.1 hypothetical protein [Nonomuraea cypriaca]
MLHFIDVSDGTVLDTIRLDGGTLVYDTGEARDVVESVRRRTPGGSDQAVYDALVAGGWSNGYATIRAT